MEPHIRQDILSAPRKAPHSFQNLPGEIRNDIYKMVLLQPGGRKRGWRRRFQGCTKILRLNKQIYTESHWLLHDSPQVLNISIGDGNSGCGPLFRFWKTKYKRSKGNPVCPWWLYPQPKVNSAVYKFTALEFRTFSNVTLQIEYCGENVPSFWPESTYFECQAHTLRVLMGSKLLKSLTLSLRAWNPSPESGLALHEHNEVNLLYAFYRLVPFIRLGGADTKIVVENVQDDSDRVVSMLNIARSRYLQILSVDPIMAVHQGSADDFVTRGFNWYLDQILLLTEECSFPSQSGRSYILSTT